MSDKKTIETRLVYMTEYSKIGEHKLAVVKSQAEFESLTGEELKEPVNFCDEMLIVAALGARRSGGYQAIIDKVIEEDGKMHVSVMGYYRGGFVTMAQTCPITVVAVKKTDMEVCFTFTKEREPFS